LATTEGRKEGAVRYELYYWSEIPGRGEFVRLALEEAGADYVDVCRQPGGDAAMQSILQDETLARPPFAPPFLKAGDLLIAQTANILAYLGAHHGLAPRDEAGRLWANQLQLTIADFLVEIHDTHHPIGANIYYEDQRDEAKRRSADFLKHRAPKYLGYFERVLARNADGNGHLVGDTLTYPDLSLFQIVAGLRYAFPRAMARWEKQHPRIVALHGMVAERPRIAAYLASERRIPFNEYGIFRHYKELDAKR
jgi:glutathione S-transferase